MNITNLWGICIKAFKCIASGWSQFTKWLAVQNDKFLDWLIKAVDWNLAVSKKLKPYKWITSALWRVAVVATCIWLLMEKWSLIH